MVINNYKILKYLYKLQQHTIMYLNILFYYKDVFMTKILYIIVGTLKQI